MTVHTVVLPGSTLEKWGLSNFAFQSFQGFIGTLKKKKISIPLRDSLNNPNYPLLSTLISTRTEPGTFIALQMKAFDPKKFKFHAGVKKCHFGNFLEWAGMAVPCQCGPQESLTGFQKLFLLRVPMISQQCWKAKLERAHFFKVQSGKTTV